MLKVSIFWKVKNLFIVTSFLLSKCLRIDRFQHAISWFLLNRGRTEIAIQYSYRNGIGTLQDCFAGIVNKVYGVSAYFGSRVYCLIRGIRWFDQLVALIYEEKSIKTFTLWEWVSSSSKQMLDLKKLNCYISPREKIATYLFYKNLSKLF